MSIGEAPGGFRFLDPRQERIFRRLRTVGPGPAANFRDACAIVNRELLRGAATVEISASDLAALPLTEAGRGVSLESASHLAAHLLREVESAIRDVALPSGYERKGATQDSDLDVEKEDHKKEIRAVSQFYDLAGSDIESAWLRLADRKSPASLHRLAHRNALGPPRPVDDTFINVWRDAQAVFDTVLEKFETQYLNSIALLDELIAKEMPGKKDLKSFRQKVPHNHATHRHFFGGIGPQWFSILRSNRYFGDVPSRTVDAETGAVTFVPWPQGDYLVRMAKVPAMHEEVAVVAETLPATDNPYVNMNIVDVAHSLPPHLSVKLTAKVIDLCHRPEQHPLLAYKLGSLVEHLAAGGHVTESLRIAGELFDVDVGHNREK
jgi:hypothetical protein